MKCNLSLGNGKYNPLQKVTKTFWLLLLTVSLTLPLYGQDSDIKGSWSMEILKISEVTADNVEKAVNYDDVKGLIDGVFERLELKAGGQSIIASTNSEQNSTYTVNGNVLKVYSNGKELSYQYSLSNSGLLLTREFKAGNVSGELTTYKLSMQFSSLN